MKLSNISESKAQLSSLVEDVLRGEEVVLTRAGKPVVRMLPYQGSTCPRVPGAMKGEIQIAADFDVLPDDIARAFGVVE